MKIQTLAATVVLSITLSACQTTPKAPVLPTPSIPSESGSTQIEAVQHNFKITGKIGVRTPEQNGSAFYGWTQEGEHFAIDLTGAMGIGQTSIRGIPGKVTLNSSKTGIIEASTPEELLFQATKWQAPITYLVSWINGEAVEKDAMTQKDPLNRLIAVQEGGWHTTFSYAGSEKLPNKLVLIENEKQNRVTLTIQSRE